MDGIWIIIVIFGIIASVASNSKKKAEQAKKNAQVNRQVQAQERTQPQARQQVTARPPLQPQVRQYQQQRPPQVQQRPPQVQQRPQQAPQPQRAQQQQQRGILQELFEDLREAVSTQLPMEHVRQSAAPAPAVKQGYAEGEGFAQSMEYQSTEGVGTEGGTLRRHAVKPFTESGHSHSETSSEGILEDCLPAEEDIPDASYGAKTAAMARTRFSNNDIVNGLIYSEILGKPKALRKN